MRRILRRDLHAAPAARKKQPRRRLCADVLLPAPGIERLHLREGLPERAVCLIRRTDRPRSVAAAALETMLLSLQNK